MTPQHAGPRIPHDGPDPLPHVRAIAVGRAIGTRGLVLLKRAFLQPQVSVAEKLFTFWAQLLSASVMGGAVNARHCLNGCALSGDPLVDVGHLRPDLLVTTSSSRPPQRHEGWPTKPDGLSQDVRSGSTGTVLPGKHLTQGLVGPVVVLFARVVTRSDRHHNPSTARSSYPATSAWPDRPVVPNPLGLIVDLCCAADLQHGSTCTESPGNPACRSSIIAVNAAGSQPTLRLAGSQPSSPQE